MCDIVCLCGQRMGWANDGLEFMEHLPQSHKR